MQRANTRAITPASASRSSSKRHFSPFQVNFYFSRHSFLPFQVIYHTHSIKRTETSSQILAVCYDSKYAVLYCLLSRDAIRFI